MEFNSLATDKNWQKYSLEEICLKITSGGTPSRQNPKLYKNGNINWIKTKELNNGYIFESEEKITEEAIKRSSAKLLPVNTILLAMYGATVGELGILGKEMACNQACCALIIDPKKADYRFIFYLLRLYKKEIQSLATGAAQQNLSAKTIKEFSFYIPNLEKQKKIADILSELDKKIDLNTQINQTLEQIAQALFKSWFVDFDPVRAKVQALSDGLSLEQAELAAMQAISGKTPEELTALSQTQPDRYAELAETAKAFPCEMVEVDGVEVPKGWECFSLKELSSVISKGTTPKKSSLNSCDSKETVPFIKVKDISESGQILINQVEQIPEKISSTELKRSILHKNDILISIAGTIGRVAIVPNDLENANTNQAISFIRLYNDNLVGIISTFLKSRKNQEDIASKVIQGVQANISLEVVRNIKIFLPINFDHKAILIFNSLFNKQLINQKENLLTEKLRDLLLPQLLSGEIDEK